MRTILLALALLWARPAAAQGLPPGAQRLLDSAHPESVADLKPDFHATSDGQSYYLVWKNTPAPTHWIVSLPGTNGTAVHDLSIWRPHLRDKTVGLVILQWWLGDQGRARPAYYGPREVYRELDRAIGELGLRDARLMLHGFSRGSANLYAIAALDVAQARHFQTFVASSGAVSLDFPPSAAIERGEFGAKPFARTHWITACGGRDPNPDRDGCPGMQRTARWLSEKGAEVELQIEDPRHGHGALALDPASMARALAYFLKS